MVYDKIIVDADLCLKLGSSTKYNYLEILLPLLAEHVYIHEVVNGEIITNRGQLESLLEAGVLTVLSEASLTEHERLIYQATHAALKRVMCNPNAPNKNQGEVCSLAMAKTIGIHYFATDERNLQPIIDRILNAGLGDDLQCIRVVDIVALIQQGKLQGMQRKDAKRIWIISQKSREDFDKNVWPL